MNTKELRAEIINSFILWLALDKEQEADMMQKSAQYKEEDTFNEIDALIADGDLTL